MNSVNAIITNCKHIFTITFALTCSFFNYTTPILVGVLYYNFHFLFFTTNNILICLQNFYKQSKNKMNGLDKHAIYIMEKCK